MQLTGRIDWRRSSADLRSSGVRRRTVQPSRGRAGSPHLPAASFRRWADALGRARGRVLPVAELVARSAARAAWSTGHLAVAQRLRDGLAAPARVAGTRFWVTGSTAPILVDMAEASLRLRRGATTRLRLGDEPAADERCVPSTAPRTRAGRAGAWSRARAPARCRRPGAGRRPARGRARRARPARRISLAAAPAVPRGGRGASAVNGACGSARRLSSHDGEPRCRRSSWSMIDAHLREVVQYALQKEGFSVELAADARRPGARAAGDVI